VYQAAPSVVEGAVFFYERKGFEGKGSWKTFILNFKLQISKCKFALQPPSYRSPTRIEDRGMRVEEKAESNIYLRE
jgi:hypothetical protein